MSDWKPPKFGSPIWMAIPAEDVPRGTSPFDFFMRLTDIFAS
jgi:hypothetical protein